MTDFHKYRPFIGAGIQGALTYRVNFYLYLFGSLLGAFVTYFLWRAVFLSSPHSSLNGFTLPTMILYIFLSFFTGYATISGGNYSIGQEIIDGSIAMRLLKPVSFGATYLFQEIGDKIVMIAPLSVLFLGGFIGFQFLNPEAAAFQPLNLLLYLVSALLAYLLNFYFNLCYGFLAFVFKNIWGSNMLKDSIIAFLSGTLIPLAFFPHALAVVLQFLPFASLVYTPVMIYLGKYDGGQLLLSLTLQIVWLIFFYVLSKLIWRVTIRHLSVQGG